jgi:hypothetical protein
MSIAAPASAAVAATVSNHVVPGCSVQRAIERRSWSAVGWAASATSAMYSCGMKR